MTLDPESLWKTYRQVMQRKADFKEWAQEMKEAESETSLQKREGGQLAVLKEIIDAMETGDAEVWEDPKNGCFFILVPRKAIAE